MTEKKSLISIFLIVLLVSSAILFGAFNPSKAQSGTTVIGIISSDTTWTKSNSPYNFIGNVLVDVGATLTVEKGASIQFNGFFMNVGGTLLAQGTESEKIIMTGLGISYSGQWLGRIVFLSTSINSKLEYAEITSTPNTIIGIYSSPTIDNCLIGGTSDTAIAIMAGPNAVPNITKNTISNNKDGISLDSTNTNTITQICDNEVINNSGSGITINHGRPLICTNRIENNSNGIYYYGGINGNDACTILDNIISNNTCGININPSGFGRVFNITKNLIINNDNAILLQHFMGWSAGSGYVTNNTIAKNNNGIVSNVPVDLVINQNNIYQNSNYFIKLASTSDTNATNNWWGTTDTTVISQSIYDFYDDFNLGKINFNPALTVLSDTAPIIPIFTIAASAGSGGSISPNESVSVDYGCNQIFIVTPDAGFQIVSVLMDGVPASNPYTFCNVVTAGHTISATFALAPTPSPSPSPTASPTPSPSPTSNPTTSPTSTPTDAPTQNPTAKPSPTPTVPEVPSLMIILLLMIAGSVSVLILKRKL